SWLLPLSSTHVPAKLVGAAANTIVLAITADTRTKSIILLFMQFSFYTVCSTKSMTPPGANWLRRIRRPEAASSLRHHPYCCVPFGPAPTAFAGSLPDGTIGNSTRDG